MIDEVKSFFQPGADAIKELFITQKKDEFTSFAAHEEAKRNVAHQIQTSHADLVQARNFHGALQEKISFYPTANFARSIFENTLKGPRGIAGLEDMAAAFTPAFLLSHVGSKVVEYSSELLTKKEVEFSDFKKTNAKILREAGVKIELFE